MMALARVVVVVVMCGAAAALEGLVPPDAAELLAEALGAASAPPGLSAAEGALLGRVGSALEGGTAAQRERFWGALG